jgi:hypothetical protein
MSWIINDPAFMGYIREIEGDDDVDTREAMINRAIKYLAMDPNYRTHEAINEALAAAGFDPWDGPTPEELTYILEEATRKHF